MLQCFSDRGALVIPGREMDLNDCTINARGESSVGLDPSYWRRLVMFSDAEILRKVPLLQITLGGEVIDQPILDRLRQNFPNLD